MSIGVSFFVFFSRIPVINIIKIKEYRVPAKKNYLFKVINKIKKKKKLILSPNSSK